MTEGSFPNYVRGGSGWFKPKSFRKNTERQGKIRMSRNTSWGNEKRHTFAFHKWGYFTFTEGGSGLQPFMNSEYRELHGIPIQLAFINFERIGYEDGSFSDIIVNGDECILIEDFVEIMNDKGQESLFQIDLKLWENLIPFIQKFYSADGFSNAKT